MAQGRLIMIYNPESLKAIEHHIIAAIKIMDRHIVENNIRDGGTCVIVEGIEIDFLPKGKRKPQKLQIIRQPFQGNNWEPLMIAQKYLQSQGIKTYYNCGRMD